MDCDVIVGKAHSYLKTYLAVLFGDHAQMRTWEGSGKKAMRNFLPASPFICMLTPSPTKLPAMQVNL